MRIERYPDATASVPTETVTYAYGPLGRRWSRTRAGTTQRFLYDGLDRIATLDPSGTLLEWVTFGPGIDEPLGREDASGRRLWYRANHQASVMALEDGTATTDTYRYSPYGITAATGTTPNDFRYTGREYEAGDLYYYRARYYDPTVGRFLSEDPKEYEFDTNLYRYAYDDPPNRRDPNGEGVLSCLLIPFRCNEDCFGDVLEDCKQKHSDPLLCLQRGEPVGHSVSAHILVQCGFRNPACQKCFETLIKCGAWPPTPKPRPPIPKPRR